MTYEIEDGISSAPVVEPGVPCCGVVAVANFAGVPFQRAWDAHKAFVSRPGSWRGSTYDWQRRKALKALGVEWTETDYRKQHMTFATFAEWYARPGVIYKLHCKGHVVTLIDGMMTDQSGTFPVSEHRSRRRFLTNVWTKEPSHEPS